MRCDGESGKMNNHLLKDHRSKRGEMQPLRMDMRPRGGVLPCLERIAGARGTVSRYLRSLWRDSQLAQLTDELSAVC